MTLYVFPMHSFVQIGLIQFEFENYSATDVHGRNISPQKQNMGIVIEILPLGERSQKGALGDTYVKN